MCDPSETRQWFSHIYSLSMLLELFCRLLHVVCLGLPKLRFDSFVNKRILIDWLIDWPLPASLTCRVWVPHDGTFDQEESGRWNSFDVDPEIEIVRCRTLRLLSTELHHTYTVYDSKHSHLFHSLFNLRKDPIELSWVHSFLKKLLEVKWCASLETVFHLVISRPKCRPAFTSSRMA